MVERRDRATVVAVTVAGAVVVLAIVAFAVAWVVRERPFTASVPQPPPIERLALVPLGAQQTACLAPATIRPDSQIAVIRLGTYGKRAVPLTMIASGPGYRSVVRVPPTWVDNSDVAVPVTPPERVVDGRFCVRNDGRRAVALYAADDRSETSSQTTVDGEGVGPNFTLMFIGRKPASLLDRLDPVSEAISVFRPVGRGVIWPLALILVFGVPVGLVWILRRAVREDA